MPSTSSGLPSPTAPSDQPWLEKIDRAQMFTLIDQLLPLEACLYYQVLPLSLEGSRLQLGMVDLTDQAAADYVRRMLSYINCSIVPQAISSAGHRALLTDYLHYKQQTSPPVPPISAESMTAASPPSPRAKPVDPDPRSLQETYVVDSPAELSPADQASGSSNPMAKPVATGADAATRILDEDGPPASPSPVTPATPAAPAADLAATHILDRPPAPPITSPPSAPAAIASDLPELRLVPKYLHTPLPQLVNLPPRALLRELLGRTLQQGIGRLYLENHGTYGRIVWSQNGLLQSVIEQLPPATFNLLLQNLKRFTGLVETTRTSQQIELERLYQGERVLLRLRLMPGRRGEEATLQVLRGAALKFHQQQQISKLGHDALGLAQRLQRQVSEIRERARSQITAAPPNIESLTALRNLIQDLDRQVESLMQAEEPNP